ncbi:hypothetical protein [Pseudoalteromonas luteoviolacea]|uniref:hypothetical protein n=1 Tax=Pseudoalteromonas luteoviolacea TaxID=43657 RepID=UPI0012D4AEC6|nr:hypothetical protein [Pseudoalteromonas luteoviolacea]
MAALAQGKELDDYIQEVGWRTAFIVFFSVIISHKKETYSRVIRLESLSKKT